MCELTQPTPGLMVDILHPNFGWIVGVGSMFIWALEYARIRSSKDGADVTMSMATARRLALAGGACFLVAVMVDAFLIVPSDSLLKAWQIQQEMALPAYCEGIVESATNHSAVQAYLVVLIVACFVILGAGALLLVYASERRGLKPPLSIR